MSFEDELRALWLDISNVSLPLAELRDRYVNGPGFHPRFGQLHDAYHHLNCIEQAISEYLELKKPLLGPKPDREFLMISRSAVEVAKVLLVVATDEADRLVQKTPMSAQRLGELADLAEQMRHADAASQRAQTKKQF